MRRSRSVSSGATVTPSTVECRFPSRQGRWEIFRHRSDPARCFPHRASGRPLSRREGVRRTGRRRVPAEETATVPPMGGDDLLDDGQAEPAPACVTGARLVEPHEPLEDPLALVLGDPGTVVLDAQLHAGRLPPGQRPRSSRRHAGRRCRPGCAPPGQARSCRRGPGRPSHRTCRRRARCGVPASPRSSARSSRSTSWRVRTAAPSSARVSRRSCSTSRCIRADSSSTASASSPSGRAPGWVCATSEVWRMLESGERSSWEASATNCRCRSRAPSSRPSIRFIVSASRWISSRRARLGYAPVQPVAGDLLDLAPDALDRRERPGGHHPGGAADDEQDHVAHRRAAAVSAPSVESSTSSSETATLTTYSCEPTEASSVTTM